MSTMIQIRNVPDNLHRELKARAALAGISMSDYLLREVERILRYPSREEVLARIAKHKKLSLSEEPWEALRAERDAR